MNCLTGRALTVYRSVVSGGEGESYDDLKDNLLDAMGLGIEQTRRKFWNTERKLADSPLHLLRQLDSCYARITRDCKNQEEIRQELLVGRLLSLYPSDIANYVYIRSPANAHQAAQYLQNYLDSHPWKRKNLNTPYHKEVSGFGRGMGYGGGDPGQDSKESSSRRGQFSSTKTLDREKAKEE